MTTDDGYVLWFTGLSGAGKSTVAAKLGPALAERGHRVELLDGDEVRANLCQDLGFSPEDRDTNIHRPHRLCRRQAGQARGGRAGGGHLPYRQARDRVRASVPNFVEVHVAAPVAVCAERDVKGLYARALAGELKNFTGVSDPYEPPLDPELVLHTDTEPVDESVAAVLGWLERRGLTPSLQASGAPGQASYW